MIAEAILKRPAAIHCCIPPCSAILYLMPGERVQVGPAGIAVVCSACEKLLHGGSRRPRRSHRHPCAGCGDPIAIVIDMCSACAREADKVKPVAAEGARRCREPECRKALEGREGLRTLICRSCYRKRYRLEHQAMRPACACGRKCKSSNGRCERCNRKASSRNARGESVGFAG